MSEVFQNFDNDEDPPKGNKKVEKNENFGKNPEKKEEDNKNNKELPMELRVQVENAKKLIAQYEGKTLSTALEKDASISDLEKYANVKSTEVGGAIFDMILQIQNNKRPLISLLEEKEIKRRKDMIEGTENKKGLLEKAGNRLEEKLTIEDMQMFGIDSVSDKESFIKMKQNLIDTLRNSNRDIQYFRSATTNDIREENGVRYYDAKISGFNHHDGKITVDIGAMSNYKTEESFEKDFRNTVFHEIIHTLEDKGFDTFSNTQNGIVKDVCGENKEAQTFLKGMFSEGGSITLANSISDIDTFNDYHFHSVMGLNYLFYGKEANRIPYGKIFSKLRFFGQITKEERTTLTDYLKKEFGSQPIKGYIELKKIEKNVQDKEAEENTGKIYDKFLSMAGENSKENEFMKKVYPGWAGEETIKTFREKAIKYPQKKGLS